MTRRWRSIVVAAVLMVLAGTSLHGCADAERAHARHLERGEAHFDDGAFEKARIEFKNALRLNGRDARTHWNAGRTAERLKEWRRALRHYSTATELDPTFVDARVALGKLFVLANSPERAEPVAEEILAQVPGEPTALAILGWVQYRQDDPGGALQTIELALDTDPGNEYALSMWATLAVADDRADEAAERLSNAIEADPSAALIALLAELHLGQQQYTPAIERLESLVSLEPDVLAHRLKLASAQVEAGEVETARTTLDKAVEAHPGDPNARLALVGLITRYQGLEGSRQMLERYVAEEPDTHEFRLALARLHASAGDTVQAQALREAVVSRDPSGPAGVDARVDMARTFIRDEQPARARELLDAAIEINPGDVDALLLRAGLAMDDGAIDQAIADLRLAQRYGRNTAVIARLLSEAYLHAGQVELAKESLTQSVRGQGDNASLRMLLAQVALGTSDFAVARREIDAVVAALPGEPEALEVLFNVQAEEGDWSAAMATAEEIIRLVPEQGLGYYLSGRVSHARGDLAGAERRYLESLEKQPRALEPLSSLVRVYLASGRSDEALARLQALLDETPSSHVVLNLKGEIHLARREPALAQDAFRAAIEASPGWWMPYRRLATTHLMLGQTDSALAVFDDGVAASDWHPVLAGDMALLHEREGRAEEAISIYERIIEHHPDLDSVTNNLAMLLVTHRSDTESLERARNLTERFADSPDASYVDTVGWVRLKRGETAEAVRLLEKAARMAPDSPAVRYHLASAYLAQGDSERAGQELDHALGAGRNFHGIEQARELQLKLSAGDITSL